jgi:hypothetical protein
MTHEIIIVDTNCFVRLYFSNLRPLLGVEVAGHKLVTIKELANETTSKSGLNIRHPWLAGADIQTELNAAILELSDFDDQQYDQDAEYYRIQGDEFLARLCKERNLLEPRQLSTADAKALAIALACGYSLATDEWPLREFSQFVEPDENGKCITILSSLDLLKLFQSSDQMSMDLIRSTVRGWILSDERLPYKWAARYQDLFNEPPPNAQG